MRAELTQPCRQAAPTKKLLGLGLVLALGACAGVGGSAIDPSDVLTAQDAVQREAAVQRALEANATGQGLNWENAQTGHRGTVTPVRTYKSDAGENCRIYQETITAENTTEMEVNGACRRADGLWRETSGARANAREFAVDRGYVRERYYYPYYDHWGWPRYRFGGWYGATGHPYIVDPMYDGIGLGVGISPF